MQELEKDAGLLRHGKTRGGEGDPFESAWAKNRKKQKEEKECTGRVLNLLRTLRTAEKGGN